MYFHKSLYFTYFIPKANYFYAHMSLEKMNAKMR